MKKINLIALLAAFVLTSGVVSCKNDEKPKEPDVPGPVEPNPEPTPEPEPEPDPVKKGTVKVVDHGNGKTIISEHKEDIGSTVEVFARPQKGYMPYAKVNDEVLPLEKGNGTFVLKEGENVVDVEYKNIKPVHETLPENFDNAFKEVMKRIKFVRNGSIDSVSENEFSLHLSIASHKKDMLMELNNSEFLMNFNKTTPHVVPIVIENYINMLTGEIFKYELEIDPFTFNPYGEPVEVKKITRLSDDLDITNSKDPSILEFKSNINSIIDAGLTNFINDYRKNFSYTYELYDLGFSYYPKSYEIEHSYKEFLGTSKSYGKGLASALNYLEANSDDDTGLIFGGYGIQEAALITNYGFIQESALIKFDNFLRFCLFDSVPLDGAKGLLDYLIDIPFNSSDKIRIHGFSNFDDELHTSDDPKYDLSPSIEFKYDFELDITKPFTYKTTSLIKDFDKYVEPWAVYVKGMSVVYDKVDTKIKEAAIEQLHDKILYRLKCAMANNRQDVLDFNRFNFQTSGDERTTNFYKGLHYVSTIEKYEEAHKTFVNKLRKLIREGAGSTLEETSKVIYKSSTLTNFDSGDYDVNSAKPTFIGVEENGNFNIGFEYDFKNKICKTSLTFPDADLSSYETRIAFELYDKVKDEHLTYVYDVDALGFRASTYLRGKGIQIPYQELDVNLKGLNEILPEGLKTPISGNDVYIFEESIKNIISYLSNNICVGEEIYSTGYRSYSYN